MLPLYENIMGDFTMLALFMAELSNPAMTYRIVLRQTGRRYTKCYEVSEIAFLITYTFARMVACLPVAY